MTHPQQKSGSGRRNAIVAAALVVLFGSLIAYLVHRGVSFDFHTFLQQLRLIDPLHACAAILLIYVGYFARAYRWSIFLRAHRRVPAMSLVAPQFIGFAGVAIFGRIADLSRPYLIARKTKLPLSLQVAVYTIERMFDLGAAALIFSSALAFTPRDLPHHEVFVRVGVFSLAGTLFLAAFAVVIRVAGVRVAAATGRLLSRISPAVGESAQTKVLAFREGLNALDSIGSFAATALLSLLLWFLIALAYVETVHAFVHEPTLAHLTFSRTMLLMGASIGGSLLQLPILGWFTQIATTAAAMHAFYGTPLEPATACGALLLIVTFLSIIPAGLILARVDRVRLGELRAETDAAAESLA